MRPSSKPANCQRPVGKPPVEQPREFNQGKKEMPVTYKSVSALVSEKTRRQEKGKR